MGRTACTEPQCLYKGALYPLPFISLQIVVQCFISVGAEQFGRLDFTKKEFVSLTCGTYEPSLGARDFRCIFGDWPPENLDGWLLYLQ
jgi:hypothetical protein